MGGGTQADAACPHGPNDRNLGVMLGQRLVEIGCTSAFAVPGDFNLLLLDQMLKVPQLEMVWCCNELNAGYAADGFARKRGVGCVVVTFCVGGLSAINAIAGAMSEDLPVIIISGGPNSNDFGQNRVLHHTVGLPDTSQQLQAFKQVTCHQALINSLDDAAQKLDTAISAALAQRKPAYVEISCNLADLVHPSFARPPVPYSLPTKHTNHTSLDAAVDAALQVLNKAVKPVLLAGPRVRWAQTRSALLALAEASQYPLAILPDAKGMVPEDHPNYIGMYWGAVSSACVCEIVESADVVITVGAVWTDYTTVGYSLLLNPNKVIRVAPSDQRVTILGGMSFGCITPEHFLQALAAKVKPNPTAHVNWKRMFVGPAQPPPQPAGELLVVTNMFKHIQTWITSDMAVIAETGDSWFNALKLRLPRGAGFEIQMRYGSIGWSVGAVLGYALAARSPPAALSKASYEDPDGCGVPALAVLNGSGEGATNAKRVVAFIGDGSFQVTAQEVSTMLRYKTNPIIFLINNGAYTIEVEIHDGPYNELKVWDYTAFITAINGGKKDGLFTAKVRTEEELQEVLGAVSAPENADKLCFVEVFTHREDCSKELLEWGSRVAAANSRPPNAPR